MYIVPEATIGAEGMGAQADTSPGSVMANNFRIYASALLVLEFVIVAVGVRFVQLFAPVFLLCLLVSVATVYAGAVHKTIDPTAGPSSVPSSALPQPSSPLPPPELPAQPR